VQESARVGARLAEVAIPAQAATQQGRGRALRHLFNIPKNGMERPGPDGRVTPARAAVAAHGSHVKISCQELCGWPGFGAGVTSVRTPG